MSLTYKTYEVLGFGFGFEWKIWKDSDSRSVGFVSPLKSTWFEMTLCCHVKICPAYFCVPSDRYWQCDPSRSVAPDKYWHFICKWQSYLWLGILHPSFLGLGHGTIPLFAATHSNYTLHTVQRDGSQQITPSVSVWGEDLNMTTVLNTHHGHFLICHFVCTFIHKSNATRRMRTFYILNDSSTIVDVRFLVYRYILVTIGELQF